MIKSARGRIVAVGILLLLQLTLFPLYAQQPVNPAAHVYPDGADVVDSPTEYVGEQVEITGIVEDTEPLSLRVNTAGGSRVFVVSGVELSPVRGDKVRIFGVLTGERDVRATAGFVVPEQGRWYAWGISFIAGLWVLYRLTVQWTVDWSTLGFKPRTKPLSVRAMVVDRIRSEEKSDA